MLLVFIILPIVTFVFGPSIMSRYDQRHMITITLISGAKGPRVTARLHLAPASDSELVSARVSRSLADTSSRTSRSRPRPSARRSTTPWVGWVL